MPTRRYPSLITSILLLLILSSCDTREEPAPPPPAPPAPAEGSPTPHDPSAREPAGGIESDKRRAEAPRVAPARPSDGPRRGAAVRRNGGSFAAPRPRIDPSDDPFASIDKAIQSMEKANIAFNAPKTLNRDDTVMIHLLLSMSKTSGDLAALLKGKGDKETATVPVTGIMQAHLVGPNFQVTPITPIEQPISRREKTEWKWNVKPTALGEQDLHLTLSAILSIGGTERKYAIRTFDHIIRVEVTTGQRVADFVSGNWQWLWAVIVVPVAGAIWQAKRKQPDKPKEK